MRVQKAENVNKALDFINSRGVKLTNIGPEGTSAYVVVFLRFWLRREIRHCRRKHETYPRNDLDSHPSVHYC